MYGTLYIAGQILPIERLFLDDGRIAFQATLPADMEHPDISECEWRVHAPDGSLVARVERFASPETHYPKPRGKTLTIISYIVCGSSQTGEAAKLVRD